MKDHASHTKEFGFYVEKILQGNYIISFVYQEGQIGSGVWNWFTGSENDGSRSCKGMVHKSR